MYYTVYKITNLINNKIYIGVHKTSNLEDDYMGSGKIIKRAIKKYGLENFSKEYIKIFNNSEDMFNMESELVNEEFVNDKETYNLKIGGFGGFDYINSNGLSITNTEHMKMMSDKGWSKALDRIEYLRNNDEEWNESRKESISTSHKKKYEDGYANPFKEKKHSLDTKKKMSESHKGKHEGTKNSQYGTMWIHNIIEKTSKKIKKDEFQDYEDLGWIKGRKMKFD
jgi:hypothetical protein